VLHRDGTFSHEGIRVTHPKLHAVLLRGVAFSEEDGVFITRLGHFRGQIEVEDTPFFVVAYDPDTGEIDLSDRTSEPLRVETLTLDPDGVLRCQVKGAFPARFTRTGQAHLLAQVEPRDGGLSLRLGRDWIPLSVPAPDTEPEPGPGPEPA
jgi:hypothetical protein